MNPYHLLIIIALSGITHGMDTLFYQTIPFTEDNSSLTYGNLLSATYGTLSDQKQSLQALRDITFLKDINLSQKAGVLVTISFINPPWKTNLSSSVSVICALGINRQPFLKYLGQYYQSQNTLIDKRNYLQKGQQCQFLLNFKKISTYDYTVFNSMLNQLKIGIFNTNSNNQLDFTISIVDFNINQFSCINNCSSKGSCNQQTGDCQCQTTWGDSDCSQPLTILNLSSDFAIFTPALSYSTLTYFSYAFSTIQSLTFYFYYSLYSVDSLKCYFGYEVSPLYKFLPDRWSYDRYIELIYPDINSVYQVSFSKVELTSAFLGVDTSNESPYRIIIGCYAYNSLYTDIQDNSPSILTQNFSKRHLSTTTYGKIAIKVDNKSLNADDSTYTNNSLSFIIAVSISGAVFFSLLVFIVICTRRRRKLMKMREQNALLALNELHRNNPQLAMNQGAISQRNQNAFSHLAKAEHINAEKKYFQDIERYFPLLTLAQIHNYFRNEIPSLKEEDLDKECAICCCDFLDDPLKQGSHKDEEKQYIKWKSSLLLTSNAAKQTIILLDGKSQPSSLAKSAINDQMKATHSTLDNTPQINKNSFKGSFKAQNPANLRLFTICNHFFHASCINDWLKKDKSCPDCRQKIGQTELNNLQGNLEENAIQRTQRLLTSIKRMKNNTSSMFSITSRNSFSPGNFQNITQKNNIKNNIISSQSSISPQDSPPLLKQSPFIISRDPLENSIILRENQSFYDPQNFLQDNFLEQNGKDNDSGLGTSNQFKETKPPASQNTELHIMTDEKLTIESNKITNFKENHNQSQTSTNNNLNLLSILDSNDESPNTSRLHNKQPNDFFNHLPYPLSPNNSSIRSKQFTNSNFSSSIVFGSGLLSRTKLTHAQNTILRLMPANAQNKQAFEKSCNIELNNFSEQQ